jgi:hypothetical protein
MGVLGTYNNPIITSILPHSILPFPREECSKNFLDRELETVEITTLIVYFSTGLVSLPVLIKTIFEISDFALGFNMIVDMETFDLRGGGCYGDGS